MGSVAGFARRIRHVLTIDRLRQRVRSARPDPGDLRRDVVAGLPGAISGVPDGMAAGALAGVSPVHGLYASVAGPVIGGLGTGTGLMVVTTTSAAALAAGSALSGVAPADRPGALTLLTLLAGVAMIVAGVLRLGRYTRFVSHSVMIGFLTGVAVNIVLGQLADLVGSPAEGDTNVAKALDVVTHPGRADGGSVAVGAAALVALVALARTPLAKVAPLVALAIPSVAAALAGGDVARVDDGGPIPAGVPLPALPDLSTFSFDILGGALAVAAIVLVQGAGVTESARNADGPTDPNRDFVGQGAGNVGSALLGGMPVGGSVGQTAINVEAGARTRWSVVSRGLWLLVILVVFSTLVGKVAVPTLAAILVMAGVSSVRVPEIRTIWRTGPNSRIAIVATFAATLLLPVAAAVAIGVVLSLLLQLNQEAVDLSVVELVVDDDGRPIERPAPEVLPSRAVTVLDVYGSLHYAGARTLQVRLPDPSGSEHGVVVLRLRGRTTFGATFYAVAADYAERLEQRGGRLFLSGLDPVVAERLAEHAEEPLTGPARLRPARAELGRSTREAVADAQTWLVRSIDSPVDDAGDDQDGTT